MSDRIKKPGTTTYLLRDVPQAQLRKAHAALATGHTRKKTLKDVFLRSVEKLATTHDRRAKRVPSTV